MKKITVPARGKINLTLDVLGKRPDGYHEVEMVMQALEIHDLVTVQDPPGGTTGITLTGEMAGGNGAGSAREPGDSPAVAGQAGPGAGNALSGEADPGSAVLWDESNLVYRAAAALFQRAGYRGGVAIHVRKVIPVAAGLAGGSADAAATLVALNRWGSFGFTLDQLMEIGATLGSDIPFCLLGGTALARGRGEKVTPLPPLPPFWVVLAKPPVGVSTAEVYRAFTPDRVTCRPDTGRLLRALEKGDRQAIAANLANVLETVTIPWHPVIREIKEEMLQAGALGALMSGSGPTVFALADSEELAERVARGVRRLVGQVMVTRTALGLPDGARSSKI